MTKSEDFPEKYEWIRRITDEAIAQRSVHSQFHGIEQELREMQKAIVESYIRTKPITHPRDKGDHREEILRHFISSSGLVPKKYSISKTRMRAVSTTGHVSPELDLVFYKEDELIVLKRFAETLEYAAIESVHGTIQVKSKLTKKALIEGLENIARFKSLQPNNVTSTIGGFTMSASLPPRFGILFAYEYDFDWLKIISEVNAFAAKNGNLFLPNAIVILDKGIIRFGEEEKYWLHQKDFTNEKEMKVYGHPDISGSCLLNFYSIVMDLLQNSTAGAPDINDYMRLPLIAGNYSYSYSFGATAETAECEKHGPFLRTIAASDMEKIVAFAQTAEPINWIRATDIASGENGDNFELYERQPGMVRIYNPENLTLRDILINDNGFTTFDSIDAEKMTIWLPWYYVVKDGLISRCPKCNPKPKRIKAVRS